jgi:UDP-N-acetylmuramoyl-tripeptide--D-alanyl-D-alanine ligase
MFFALKGARFDGNSFALEALNRGAALAVVDDAKIPQDPRLIRVQDVLKTLQELATFHRVYCKTPIVSLTGSNGKTTTKELIAAVLSKKFKTLFTSGNFNNEIGVPLTLLRLTPETEIAVVEMGANHQGEIRFLCNLAKPDYGYITNFGKAHLEGFGGVEGVIKGKSEMYDYLTANLGTLFWNNQDPIQSDKLKGYKHKVGFGPESGPGIYPITLLDADPFVRLKLDEVEIQTHLIGAYNFTNCAAASAIGMYFGVSVEAIREALESYVPANNRSQLMNLGSRKIILDAYNANPSSMTVALENFKKLEVSGKVAILGDMFELGEDAPSEHLAIGKLAQTMGLDKLYLVGENFCKTGLEQARYSNFDSLKAELLKNPIPPNATILIKGSRGMALERVLELL